MTLSYEKLQKENKKLKKKIKELENELDNYYRYNRMKRGVNDR